MLTYILFFGPVVLIGSVVFGFYIRSRYLEYDRRETLKEEIDGLKHNVGLAMDYFRRTYCNDFDHTVYETIRIKVDFMKDLIERFDSLERKKYYYDRLYKMLYETGVRLKRDFMNISYIIAPLKGLLDELVSEKIEFLKKAESETL